MSTGPSTDKAAALLALHAGPGFVLPNAWDAGSARILEHVGFPAIATTSAGIAWSCGVPDGGTLDGDTMLERNAFDRLSRAERKQFLGLLEKVLARVAELADATPTPLDGRRNRPARLDHPPA